MFEHFANTLSLQNGIRNSFFSESITLHPSKTAHEKFHLSKHLQINSFGNQGIIDLLIGRDSLLNT